MENMAAVFRKIAIISIAVVTAIAIAVLAGWYFNSYELKGSLFGTGAMNPVTALIFILFPATLFLSARKPALNQKWAKWIVLLPITISLIRLSEMFFAIPVNVSEIIFAHRIQADYAAGKPNAIAPNTAILSILLGISIFFLSDNNRVKKNLADISACCALLISSLSVIGHIYHTPEFYFINSLIPMVLSTAICFCLLSFALLFYRSDMGLSSVLTSKYQGSRTALYLLPFAIIIPIAAGGLNLYVQRSGMYSSGYGTALFSMVTVVLLVLLILQSARSINKSNRQLVREVKVTKRLSLQLREEQQKAFEQTLALTKLKLNQQLIEATINGQEKEKKQMGMELHDHINQILASTKMYIEMAGTDEKLRSQLLKKSGDQLSYAMSEIRNLSKSMVLHSEATGGIYQQMCEMVEHIQRTTCMTISMNIPENLLNQLNSKRQVAIYRIVEEQLNNIVKHANADSVNIIMLKDGCSLQLHVEDNGKGFDPESKRRGIGLSNIQSRTEMLHGQMNIVSATGRGCNLKITFPENAAEMDHQNVIATTDINAGKSSRKADATPNRPLAVIQPPKQ
jgi:signal transduction histidine kinase